MQARKDLLDARRRDIEETPGSRFLAEHGGRAVGLLKDLVRIEDRASSGPSSRRSGRSQTPSSTTTARSRWPTRRAATVRSSRSRRAAPCPSGSRASGSCSRPSTPSRPPAGSSSTVLRDVYLADDGGRCRAQASRASRRVVRHARGRARRPCGDPHGDARPTCDCARSAPSCRCSRTTCPRPISNCGRAPSGSSEIGGEVDVPAGADRGRRRGHHRCGRALDGAERELVGHAHGGRAAPAQRFAAVIEDGDRGPATVWRRSGPRPTERSARPAAAPAVADPAARRASRRSGANARRSTTGWHELRAERDQLAAHDPVRLREDLAGAETARVSAEAAVAAADEAFAAATGDARGGGRGRARRGRAPRRASTRAGATPRPRSTSLRRALRGRGPLARRHRATDHGGRAPAPGGLPGRPRRALADAHRGRLRRDDREAPGAGAASPRACSAG